MKHSFIKQHFPLHLSWARLVSDVISPPAVWAVMVVPVALKYSSDPLTGLMWAALYGFFVSLIPVLFIMRMVAIGKIGDVHMKERRERFIPFLVTLFSTLIVLGLLRYLHAPPAFGIITLISFVQIAITSLITLAWQISMHMMSISAAAVAVGIIFGISTGFAIIPLVMLVGAARLQLKRHTPAQVIAGTILGAAAPVLLLVFLPDYMTWVI